MSLIFVDVEAFGGAPCVGKMTEFGAVEFKSRKTFHGILWIAKPDIDHPVTSRLDENAIQKSEEERKQIIIEFDIWLKQFGPRPIFISDNNGYDWQWINDAFWKYLNYNPFGHSSRRISDFYAGLVNNFYLATKWKHLRVTTHDHNPINDAMGNVEAFERILNGER